MDFTPEEQEFREWLHANEARIERSLGIRKGLPVTFAKAQFKGHPGYQLAGLLGKRRWRKIRSDRDVGRAAVRYLGHGSEHSATLSRPLTAEDDDEHAGRCALEVFAMTAEALKPVPRTPEENFLHSLWRLPVGMRKTR